MEPFWLAPIVVVAAGPPIVEARAPLAVSHVLVPHALHHHVMIAHGVALVGIALAGIIPHGLVLRGAVALAAAAAAASGGVLRRIHAFTIKTFTIKTLMIKTHVAVALVFKLRMAVHGSGVSVAIVPAVFIRLIIHLCEAPFCQMPDSGLLLLYAALGERYKMPEKSAGHARAMRRRITL